MARFWIEDSFIRREIKNHNLSPLAALVYITLACHANKQGYTFVGTRHLGELLNVSKSAVARAIKELQSVPLVGQRQTKVSQIRVLTVPLQGQTVPPVGQKEVVKEVYKEEPLKKLVEQSTKGQYSAAKERLRAKFAA